jgi:hypothetical protein
MRYKRYDAVLQQNSLPALYVVIFTSVIYIGGGDGGMGILTENP